MKFRKIFNEGDLLISNYIPELCILNIYNKSVEIIKSYTVKLIGEEHFLIADIKILESNRIEKGVFIPLDKKVFVNNNELMFLGKQLDITNLNKLEQKLFLKMFEFSLKHYLDKEYFTINNLDTISKEYLIKVSEQSIEYKIKTSSLLYYLPLITLKYDEETEQLIYAIPLLKHLRIIDPSTKAKVINENFDKLKINMQTKLKESFEQAKEKEFSL